MTPAKEEGRTDDAAHFKSNKQQTSLWSYGGSVKSYGVAQLCAWKVASAVFWFQTTDRKFARKLAKRQDASRVGIDGVNHFRQTFQICGTWRKVRRIIDRYFLSAGDQNFGNRVAQDRAKDVPRVNTAVPSNRRSKAVLMRGGVH